MATDANAPSHGPSTSGRDPEWEVLYSKGLARAARLINYRERTETELRGRLKEDGCYERSGLVDAIVSRLQDLGLLDDERFAESWVRSRWGATKKSPSALRWELTQKGISGQTIDRALAARFGHDMRVKAADHQSEEEEEVWSTLVEEAARRAQLTEGQDREKRRAKLARWLASRGHNWDTASRVLRVIGL